MANKTFREEFQKSFKLPCDCGCGIVQVSKFIDGEGSIDYFGSCFYEWQSPIIYHITESLKAIWCILTGKRYRLYEIVISEETWEDFKKFVESV